MVEPWQPFGSSACPPRHKLAEALGCPQHGCQWCRAASRAKRPFFFFVLKETLCCLERAVPLFSAFRGCHGLGSTYLMEELQGEEPLQAPKGFALEKKGDTTMEGESTRTDGEETATTVGCGGPRESSCQPCRLSQGWQRLSSKCLKQRHHHLKRPLASCPLCKQQPLQLLPEEEQRHWIAKQCVSDCLLLLAAGTAAGVGQQQGIRCCGISDTP
nr:uncharacterized protein LOC119717077 [Anas platyrhynchos]